MFPMLNALWRPITGFVMSAVVLLVAMGWLPPSAEVHAGSLLAAAGTVLATLTAARAVNRAVEVKADEAKAAIAAKVEELVPGTLLTAEPPKDLEETRRNIAAMRDELVGLRLLLTGAGR